MEPEGLLLCSHEPAMDLPFSSLLCLDSINFIKPLLQGCTTFSLHVSHWQYAAD
jgi:hypothetical protein